jgi:hypothetical protein
MEDPRTVLSQIDMQSIPDSEKEQRPIQSRCFLAHNGKALLASFAVGAV